MEYFLNMFSYGSAWNNATEKHNVPYTFSYKVSQLIRNSWKAFQMTSGLSFADVQFGSINLYGNTF